MIKFKNVKEFDLKENKFDKFIYGLIEGKVNGDWNNYEDGEEVIYDFDLREEEWIDLDFNMESLENYIGEGISYVNEYNDYFENVEIKDWNLVVSNIFKNI
jgi:hypothetical protein